MANQTSKVYLGYEDESILEKHVGMVNFTTNKIGGYPDWYVKGKCSAPSCPLCGLERPLILQIYAPLESSQYHRTLYIFACINPNCWGKAQSWSCIRCQGIDTAFEETNLKSSSNVSTDITAVTQWCSSADDWDIDENASFTSNNNEENGNVISETSHRISDEDDEESKSLELDTIQQGMGNMVVDDRNANNGAQGGGAVGRLNSPGATAELEGDESELVSIDTPTAPQTDLLAMLHQVPDLPSELCTLKDTRNALTFESSFIVVEEEYNSSTATISEHVRELMQEYQLQNDDSVTGSPVSPGASGGGSSGGDGLPMEQYENGTPAHGDLMFHHFLSRIQEHPGQIIRYSWSGPPLLISPLQDTAIPQQCCHCGGEMIFELQILSTIISKLRLLLSGSSHLEFGTVLIFTCKKSCWNYGNTMLSEAVVVQYERM